MSNKVQIRNKRLAKLGAPARPGKSRSESSDEGRSGGVSALSGAEKLPSKSTVEPDEKESSKSSINLTKHSNVPKTIPNSISQVGIRTIGNGPQINITPAAGRPVTPAKRDHASSTRDGISAESLDEWENKILGGIFGLTLNPNISQDSHGHTLHYVPGVKSDLEEQGEFVRFRTAVLDQAIVEVASNLGKPTPLDYLLGCWKRVSRQLRSFKGANAENAKYKIVKEAQRLCMSYCIFAVTMPDMFG